MTARPSRIFLGLWLAACGPAVAAGPAEVRAFLDAHCTACHDAETKNGNLDLTALKPPDARDEAAAAAWERVHDRVKSGQMPPKKAAGPDRAEREAFVAAVAGQLVAADRDRAGGEGRSTRRRLNRSEYEATLRDLLSLPALRVRDYLPEDGEAHGFNKVGDALDVSHVNLARYLDAADAALRHATASQVNRPERKTTRYYARDQRGFTKFFRAVPVTRGSFPVLGYDAQPDVLTGKAPKTVGPADPATRDREAVGVVVSSYEPIEPEFSEFTPPVAGRYRLRFSAYPVWVASADPAKASSVPDFSKISAGRRPEPVTVYAHTAQKTMWKVGAFDAKSPADVNEMTVWLEPGERIRPDAARLYRARPGMQRNPFVTTEGMPGVAYKWMEVDGPLTDQWPEAGHRLLFGDLPMAQRAGRVEVVPRDAERDAAKLIRGFLARAYRRPVVADDEKRFLGVFRGAAATGLRFTDALIAAYSAVLCSPEFLYLDEAPGRLSDRALAARLSYFLWNTAPDDELRRLAADGKLRTPDVLRRQTERLLSDPKSRRFVDAFLDYWLDLRKVAASAPDAILYPDYQLDDLLVESMTEEPPRFFAELISRNLPAKNLIDSDFAVLNERMATHYGIPGVEGVSFRRVALPPGSVRGGLMTQAAVLKVTANGTTTSPVIRGAWVADRLLGTPPSPPPPGVPAVEPDIRGATTIREQLAKHRADRSCAACHRQFDPPGFALECFDPMGGWRDHYRAVGVAQPVKGSGHNGYSFTFGLGPAVDPSGTLADGREFRDVRGLKSLLLADEEAIARNLVRQLTVYATGSPVRFSDRAAVDAVLARSKPGGYGVRTLIHELVQSDLFRSK